MALVGVPSTIVYSRPNRSRPGCVHVVVLDGPTLAPLDCEHPCTCEAGQKSVYCWAVLSVLQVEAVAEAGWRYRISSETNKAESEQLLREVCRRGVMAGHLLDQRTTRSRAA